MSEPFAGQHGTAYEAQKKYERGKPLYRRALEVYGEAHHRLGGDVLLA